MKSWGNRWKQPARFAARALALGRGGEETDVRQEEAFVCAKRPAVQTARMVGLISDLFGNQCGCRSEGKERAAGIKSCIEVLVLSFKTKQLKQARKQRSRPPLWIYPVWGSIRISGHPCSVYLRLLRRSQALLRWPSRGGTPLSALTAADPNRLLAVSLSEDSGPGPVCVRKCSRCPPPPAFICISLPLRTSEDEYFTSAHCHLCIFLWRKAVQILCLS